MAADGKELLQELGMLHDPVRKFQGNARTAKQNQPFPKVCSGVAVPAQEGNPGVTRGLLCTFRLGDATEVSGGAR